MVSRSRKALILALAQTLATFTSLVLFSFLSRVLTTHDYATYRQTLLFYSILGPFLGAGLPGALLYFLPVEQKLKKAVLLENLLALATAGLALSLFILGGGDNLLATIFNNPELKTTLKWFAFQPIFLLPTTATSACLLAEGRISQLAIFNIISKVLLFALVIMSTLILAKTPTAAIIGSGISAMLSFFLGSFLMWKSIAQGFSPPTLTGIKKQFSYGIPLGLGAMMGVIHKNVDKVIVSKITCPDIFAVYVNGATEVPFLNALSGSATNIMLPEMRKMFNERRQKEIVPIWRRAASKLALVFFPAMAFLFLASENLLVIVFSEKFRGSAFVFKIYLMVIPVRIFGYGAIFQAAGRTDLVMKRTAIVLVVNLILSLGLAYFWGYKAVAVATVLAIYGFSLPYSLHYCAKLLDVSLKEIIPWRILFEISSIIAILLVVMLLFRNTICCWNNEFYNVLMLFSLFSTLYLSALFLLRRVSINIKAKSSLKEIVRLNI